MAVFMFRLHRWLGFRLCGWLCGIVGCVILLGRHRDSDSLLHS